MHLNKWERKCLERYSRHEGGGDMQVLSSLATKGLIAIGKDHEGDLTLTVTEAGHAALKQ